MNTIIPPYKPGYMKITTTEELFKVYKWIQEHSLRLRDAVTKMTMDFQTDNGLCFNGINQSGDYVLVTYAYDTVVITIENDRTHVIADKELDYIIKQVMEIK